MPSTTSGCASSCTTITAVLKEFAADFSKFLPHLDKQELYWRLDIISGALTYAMADFGIIKRRGVSEAQHRDLAARHLVKFAAAGLMAPV